MILTDDLIYRTAQDAANRHMREHGRTRWNEEDWNISCRKADRLLELRDNKESTDD